MRVRVAFQMVLIVLLAVGLTRCKQPEEQPAETPTTTDTPPPPVGTETSAAAIPQQVQSYISHVRKMRRTVRNGETQQGSLELNEATQLLTTHATASSGEVQEYLEYSIDEFSGLAERVFTASALEPYDVDVAVTHAFWAEVLYHFSQASARWDRGNRGWVIAHLRATASYLDEAIGYQTGGIEVESEALVVQIRDLAQQLRGSAVPDDATVTALMEDIGKKIDSYNKQVRLAIEANL